MKGWVLQVGSVLRAGSGVACLGLLVATGTPLAAQDSRMNFFLSPGGPGGERFGAVIVSDGFCHDQGYAAGFGDMQWKAYLNGTEADGEAHEVARDRIGTGPWYNAHGVLIAENLADLHSDRGNLNRATAVTLHGEAAPDDFPLPPFGAGLEGSAFSRDGPLLCFGVR